MARATEQELDGRHLGELLVMALKGNGYCPTLSRPELSAMADAYDAVCRELELPNRAWRGGREVRP